MSQARFLRHWERLLHQLSCCCPTSALVAFVDSKVLSGIVGISIAAASSVPTLARQAFGTEAVMLHALYA